MPRLQNIPLTKQDFDDAQWENLIEEIQEKDCDAFSRKFFQKAHEYADSGDSKNEEIFTVLGGICSMRLEPGTERIFQPNAVFYDPPMRSFMLNDLSDENLQLLSEIVENINSPEIRARIADVLWTKGRGKYHKFVSTAVEAYLESVKLFLSSGNRPSYVYRLAILRLDRSLELANSTRQFDLRNNLLSEIESILKSHDPYDQEFPHQILLKFLLRHGSSDPAFFSNHTKELAEICEIQNNWLYASSYWTIKSDWDKLSKNKAESDASLIRAAEAHIRFSEVYANSVQPNYAAACFQLERALSIFRNIGGMREKCDEIHRKILDYQLLSSDDLEIVSNSVDISHITKNALESVKGLSLQSAILSLAFCHPPTNQIQIRDITNTLINEPSFDIFFGISIIDEKGRQTASSPALVNIKEQDREDAIKSRMYIQARTSQALVSVAMIMPITHQILLEHNLQIDDLDFLVTNNGFIPDGHSYIYKKGLYAGFRGDYLVALHLLIPQIENSLRFILNQHGVLTSGFDLKTGVQEDFTLGTLLDKEDLKNILAEDVIFDLKCLLTERFGSNLRNRLAHGLISSGEFFSSEVIVYFWWLTLRLCCSGIPQKNDSQDREI